MKITVVAIANIGTFVAGDRDENYCVITLDGTKDIDLGGILSGTFDGRGSLFYTVNNLSKRETVRICLEHWECSLPGAIQSLLEFNGVHTFLAGRKRFVLDSQDTAGKIVREIRST
jgi:hypothetical protein